MENIKSILIEFCHFINQNDLRIMTPRGNGESGWRSVWNENDLDYLVSKFINKLNQDSQPLYVI